MVRVILFDRFGNPLGDLSEDEVFGLVRTEKVNGEHSLTITTTRVLEKGWRVLTCDARGIWREHVVYGTDALHDSAERPFGSYYCVWSVQPDLMGTRVSAMPGVQADVTAATALDALLSTTTRWTRGTVTQTTQAGASMYDRSAWEALSTLVEVWGGEVDTTIGVGSAGVVSRQVDLYDKQGDQSGRRRFDFGADIKSVRRRIEDGPLYCRITPRGRGEETEGGGYGRKITIESVNDGKDYLENPAMVDLAKLPDGSGGWEYPTLEIENPDIETPADLKVWAQSVLEESTVPKVTYEVDVMQLAREGADMHGVSLGDAVQVVDRKFGGLRIAARVMEMTVNMLDEADAKLTIGQVADDLSTMFGGFGTRLNTVANAVYNMNGGTYSTAGFLNRLLERLNEEINADGGYTYITQGQGLRTYDTAVSDPLVGSEASQVVEIKGGSIRIANSKTAQGAWNWRTVFVSGHIAADLVTAVNITTGFIGNAAGDNYWDLDGDTMHITGDLTLKSRHVIMDGSSTYERGITRNGVLTVADFNTYYRLTGATAGDNNYLQGLMVSEYNDAETTEYGRIMLLPRGRSLSTDYWSSIACNHAIHLIGYYNGNSYGEVSAGTGAGLCAYNKSGSIDNAVSGIAAGSSGTATAWGSTVRLKTSGTSGTIGIMFGNYAQFDRCSISQSQFTIGYKVGSNTYTTNLQVYGTMTASGTKSRLVKTPHYNERLLYAYETPSPMFGDVGSGTIGEDGLCIVEVDDIFSETARADFAYQVFLQKCGQGDLWVESKAPTYFIVKGTPGLRFDWEMKCRQRDYETLRMEQPGLDPADMRGVEVDDDEYGYTDYINEIEQAYA